MQLSFTPRRVVVAVLIALLATIAGVVLPVQMAAAEPEVRLDELDANPGTTVDLPHPSSHLGMRWRGEETDVIALRWRSDQDGPWRAWEDAVVSHDLGDEARGLFLSGLLVTDDARQVQVRVVSGSPTDLEVIAIDTEHGPQRLVVNSAGPAPAAASIRDPKVDPPTIIRRSEWGADESMRGTDPPSFAPITRLALHHTAGKEGDDPAATVRAIYAYHTQANGWNDIGYNFLVDSQGRIYEGRYSRQYTSTEVVTGEDTQGRGVIGAHISGNNTGTVGVAVLGNFTDVAPTKNAVDAAQAVFAWKADRHDIDVLGTTMWTAGERSTLIGHRDTDATACPGNQLWEQLPAIRHAVNHIVAVARNDFAIKGYWTVGRDSALFSFGNIGYHGGSGQVPTPVMSMAATKSGSGYWILSSNGRVSPFGDAVFYGSTEAMRLNQPVVRLEPTPTGKGYWILAKDGGVFSYGDAAFFGSTGSLRLNAPVVSMAATVTGKGYWLLAGDGGVFSYGDASFHGSTGSMKLNAPVVSMAPHPAGVGYWLQASDGGIFSFGDPNKLRYYGSVPALRLQGTAPTVQIRATPSGRGYYVLGSDGGVFTFGNAIFYGAQPGMSGRAPAVDMALRVPPVEPAASSG